jgi:ketosteroid isomerase-like protein
MAAVLAEDVVWWISPSVPQEIIPSTCVGREAFREAARRVFGQVYQGEAVRIEVHSAISEGSLGTVRFTMSTEFVGGGSYSNEYCVCVETRDDEISRVWEYVDVALVMMQMPKAGSG